MDLTILYYHFFFCYNNNANLMKKYNVTMICYFIFNELIIINLIYLKDLTTHKFASGSCL